MIRMSVLFYFIITSAFAEKLEVKFNGKSLQLPYWSAQRAQHGAVLLINGRAQAQWSMLLAHLAKGLALNGWSAVLVNCKQGNLEPWIKELPEVINTLRQQKNKRIVLVHYGEQLKQTLESFNTSQKTEIEGLILLSAYDMPKSEAKKPELSMPLFDIVGQFDYEPVLAQLSFRKKEFAQNKYLAMQIPGAHHDYEYSHQLLLSFISGWISKLAEPTPRPIPISYIESIEPLMPKQLAFDEESDLDSRA